jgi:hypothetical protein
VLRTLRGTKTGPRTPFGDVGGTDLPRPGKEGRLRAMRWLMGIALLFVVACAGTKASVPPPPKAALRPPPTTEPRARVALLQLTPAGPSSAALAETLGQLVAFELEDTGRFDVLSRQDLAETLKLKGIQQAMGCETDACEANIARAADVAQLVTGSLGKLGDKYVLVLRLVDSREVRVLRQARDFAAGREEDLVAAAQRTSWTIAGIELPPDAAPPAAADDAEPAGGSGNTVLADGASAMMRDAFSGLTQGVRAHVPAALDVFPRLTADLETRLATFLAARVARMQAERRKPPATP